MTVPTDSTFARRDEPRSSVAFILRVDPVEMTDRAPIIRATSSLAASPWTKVITREVQFSESSAAETYYAIARSCRRPPFVRRRRAPDRGRTSVPAELQARRLCGSRGADDMHPDARCEQAKSKVARGSRKANKEPASP